MGWIAAIVHCPPQLTKEQRCATQLVGRVQELDYTDFSMRMTVDLLNKDLPRCHVEVSTRGCDYTLQAGDIITWKGKLDVVGNLGNPFEMDYAAHLLHDKGIRYQQHMPLSQVQNIGHASTWVTLMANTRRQLELKVFNSTLSPTAQRLVSTLLLGDKSVMDRTTRQEFSSAGLAHVLALSGLHIGIITLIIWWMLFPLDYLCLKKLRLFITLLAIGCFVVFTGQSPGVVRSALMMGVVLASLMLNRRRDPINALCLAALLILVFSPASLYLVGFQLSFITVAAILWFISGEQLMFKTSSERLNRLIMLAATTLIATLATLSLTAYYFHTVSFFSVISNLLVLPVLPLLMVLGALFLLLTAAGMHWILLDKVMDALSGYIHWVATAVGGSSWSHAGSVYVSATGAVAYLIVLILLAIWLHKRDYRYLLASGCVFALLLIHSLWIDAHMARRGLIVFNSFSSTPVLYYDNGIGYFWVPDDPEPDIAALGRFYHGFISAHGIDEIRKVDNDTQAHIEGGLFNPPLANVMNHRILAAGSGRWKTMKPSSQARMHLDNVIVTKRFNGTVNKLREIFDFDHVIVSGVLPPTELSSIMHECDSLGITAHALSQKGAHEFH